MNQNYDEPLLKEILKEIKATNVMLSNISNMLAMEIDVAMGGETLNKDFLEHEIHKNINAD